MLAIEYEADNVIEITMDLDGRDELISLLAKLRPGDHDHLSTESWGGYGLSEDFEHPDLVPIHQATISLKDGD